MRGQGPLIGGNAGGSDGEISSSIDGGTGGVAGSATSSLLAGGSVGPGSAGSSGGSVGTGGGASAGGIGGSEGATGGTTGGIAISTSPLGGYGGLGGTTGVTTGWTGIFTSPFGGYGGLGGTTGVTTGGVGASGDVGGTTSSASEPPPANGLAVWVVQKTAGDTGQITLDLRIDNKTPQSVDMSTVTLRYWYQDEGLGTALVVCFRGACVTRGSAQRRIVARPGQGPTAYAAIRLRGDRARPALSWCPSGTRA